MLLLQCSYDTSLREKTKQKTNQTTITTKNLLCPYHSPCKMNLPFLAPSCTVLVRKLCVSCSTVLWLLSEACITFTIIPSFLNQHWLFFSPNECKLKWKLELAVEYWICYWWKPCLFPKFIFFCHCFLKKITVYLFCLCQMTRIYFVNRFYKAAGKSGGASFDLWFLELSLIFCWSCWLVAAANKSWRNIGHDHGRYWEWTRRLIVWNLGTAQMLGTVCTWGFSQEPGGAIAGKGRQPS